MKAKKFWYLSLIGWVTVTAANFAEQEYSGVYWGLQYGSLNFNYTSSVYTLSTNSQADKTSHFTVQAFVGYSFSKFLGVEGSYQYYGHPFFRNEEERRYILQEGGHLMVRLNLPLYHNFSFYLRGGAGIVFRSGLNPGASNLFCKKAADRHLVLVGGGGFCHWLAKNLAFDLSVTSTLESGNLPSMQTYAVGFLYRF